MEIFHALCLWNTPTKKKSMAHLSSILKFRRETRAHCAVLWAACKLPWRAWSFMAHRWWKIATDQYITTTKLQQLSLFNAASSPSLWPLTHVFVGCLIAIKKRWKWVQHLSSFGSSMKMCSKKTCKLCLQRLDHQQDWHRNKINKSDFETCMFWPTSWTNWPFFSAFHFFLNNWQLSPPSSHAPRKHGLRRRPRGCRSSCPKTPSTNRPTKKKSSFLVHPNFVQKTSEFLEHPEFLNFFGLSWDSWEITFVWIGGHDSAGASCGH